MNDEKTGGPAFPCRIIDHMESITRDGSIYQAVPVYKEIPGMTLRDYIAIHASDRDFRLWVTTQHNTTEARYKFADAMIERRQIK